MTTGKILLIESDKELLNKRSDSLSREGYQVSAISSVQQAIEIAAEEQFDCLILKPETPELLNMLLARFPADIGVISIATPQNISLIAENAGTGIRSFLIEPVNTRKLRTVVFRTLNARASVIDALRNRALNILGQTQHMFSPGINVDKYLSIVAEMIAVGTAASGVVIFLKDESTKLFKVKTSYGDFKTEHEKLCLSFCDISNIIIIGEGTEAPVKLQQKIAGTGLTSLMSLPMTVKGENIGFIQCLRSAGNKPFAEADKNFAAVISWWSAVALDNINLFHKVEEQRMHVDELLHEVSHAQENERKRVAIEIHDGVAQWMVGATFGIKACSQLISESRLTELQTELAKIGQTLQKSVRELRRTIANLRPLALEENGFDKAIGQVVKPLLEDGIGCELQIDKELPALTFPQETTIYWIIQEALSNVRSHSAASHAIINIASGDGHLNVTVKDNGSGFNPEETIKSAIPLEHMGLLGMYERVRLLSGNMHIESHPGTGTTISVSLPLTVNETVDATT